MKRFLFFATLFAAVLTGCSKNVQTQDPLDDGTPVAVRFGASSVKTAVVKSTGAVQTEWNGQTLNIYGFDKSVTDFSTTPFINNIAAVAPQGVNKGGIDVLNPLYNEPFYYVAGKYYDFYGYHIDDAATSKPVGEATRVYVPFTIDGSQDLMIAMADQNADIAAAGAQETVTADKAYSAYAARRGVQPNLLFKHQLARFTFEIIAGSEAGSDIYVNEITLDSKNSGNLVVVGAGRGLADVAEDKVALSLKEVGPSGASQALTPVKPNTFVATKDNPVSVGESLMVIPGETSYKLSIYTSQDGVSTSIDPQEWTLDINSIVGKPEGAVAFDAGYSYKVTVLIYGLEEVKVTAELEDWKDGGSTVIDPDAL